MSTNLILTEEEKKILQLMKEGLTVKEIAPKLYLSEWKVENCISCMRDRFNCKNSVQLMSFIYENDLFEKTKENSIEQSAN